MNGCPAYLVDSVEVEGGSDRVTDVRYATRIV